LAFLLLVGALIWASSKWAYYSGFYLQSGQVDDLHDRWGFHDTTSLNRHVEQLSKQYGLSMLQRRKAREIYSKRFVWADWKDEWAREMISGEAPQQVPGQISEDETWTAWFRKLGERCDGEFEKILTDKQLKKWKEAHADQSTVVP